MKQRVVRIDKDDKSRATNKPTSKQQTRRWKASCHTAGAFCDLRQFLLQKGHPTQSLMTSPVPQQSQKVYSWLHGYIANRCFGMLWTEPDK